MTPSPEQSEAIRIVYRDPWLLAVDKPAGLMVHRSALSRGVRKFAVQEVRQLAGQRVHPVHRLDRPTSGVLLFALDQETLSAVSAQFARREIHKTYRALVRGHLEHEGVIDYPLAREKGAPKKEAITHWKALWQGELPHPVGRYPTARYTLLELCPKTGRHHQLRRHCAHLRHPIIGDTTHGDRHHNRFFGETLKLERLFLFAERLALVHPHTGEPLRMEAPVPEVFNRFRDLVDESN